MNVCGILGLQKRYEFGVITKSVLDDVRDDCMFVVGIRLDDQSTATVYHIDMIVHAFQQISHEFSRNILRDRKCFVSINRSVPGET